MSTTLIWSNIIAYALQIGLVVAAGALTSAALRLKEPRVRLIFWQSVLATCLLLPFVRGWRQEVVKDLTQPASTITAITVARGARVVHRRGIPLQGAPVLWLLGAGTALRLGWLGLGLIRLARHRRRGVPLAISRHEQAIYNPSQADLLLVEDIAGPVTFGWRHPVVLLPTEFPALAPEMREAILCHELQHVERHDWACTVAEEVVRAALWFHPAVWLVIGEIQLAREQTVDQNVVGMTQSRGAYVDALLAMAGTPTALGAPDLTPAPMFLRRRHLRRRLMDVLQEAGMTTRSTTRLALQGGLAAAAMCAVCWFATGAFQLAAAPQVVQDAPGISLTVNGGILAYRSPLTWPVDAFEHGVEGTVTLQVRVAADGGVIDAAVLSGPDELRHDVLQSVLSWRFGPNGPAVRAVGVTFARPARGAMRVSTPSAGVTDRLQPAPRPISRIPASPAPRDTAIYSVGNGVLPPTLVFKVDADYSTEARKAKYNGTVHLSAVVNTSGRAEDIKVVRSVGMGLDEKAIESVSQWLFTPGTLDGRPVNTRAVLEVNFRLL